MSNYITQVNPRGLQFDLLELSPNQTQITLGVKRIVVNHQLYKIMDSWAAWRNGAYIQVAFRYFDANEREFLMTGITAEEWDILFPSDRGDE